MDKEETTHWALRLPVDMAERVDLICKQLTDENGFHVSRSAALRMLILRGIEGYRKEGKAS
jgi:hypothetical protein